MNLAQAAADSRQVTTTTMVMAMVPMLMMMMMMSGGIYMTQWKLITTWKSMATKEDTWLEMEPTPRVELSQSPRTQEERFLGMVRAGGPGLDPSLLLCTH
jgi:hypothetical protein